MSFHNGSLSLSLSVALCVCLSVYSVYMFVCLSVCINDSNKRTIVTVDNQSMVPGRKNENECCLDG